MFDWTTTGIPARGAAITAAAIWALVCYRAGIWTQHRSQLRDITETLAHGVVFGVLLFVAIGGLPKQDSCSDEKHQTRNGDAGADDRRLVRVSMDLPARDQSRPVGMVYPLTDAYQDPANATHGQRFSQIRVISQGQSANDQSHRQRRQRPIPLVSGEPLEFVHAQFPHKFPAQHSAKAGAA